MTTPFFVVWLVIKGYVSGPVDGWNTIPQGEKIIKINFIALQTVVPGFQLEDTIGKTKRLP